MKENIEEVVERLEKSINDVWFSTTYSQEDEERDLQTLLSDYKRVLKENEELKHKYDKALSDVIAGVDLDNTYIPKQKIKDKIEELEEKRIKMEKDDIGVGFTLGEEWSNLKSKIKAYKDLLEEKGE